jgi:adenosylhomocysteine nucleosidase
MRAAVPTIGIVTGLRFERGVLMRWRGALGARMPQVTCAGANAERAAQQAQALVEGGVHGLISFGIAGGLDPDLSPGLLLLPHEVANEDAERFACDAAWCEALRRELASNVAVIAGVLASTAMPVAGVAEKRMLREKLDAHAVDMESAAVASVAQRHGVPFIAIRAIADTADQALPAAALTATREDGSVSLARALVACLHRPGDIAALVRLGRHTGLARRTLARVAHRGLPRFGLVA